MKALSLAVMLFVGCGAPAVAETAPSTAFWKSVQAICDAAAATPAKDVAKRIAQGAIDEFYSFGGHQIDSDGKLIRYGTTEGDHDDNTQNIQQAQFGNMGWWRVLKYWRALSGSTETAVERIEAWGYRDASTSTQDTQSGPLLRLPAAQLLAGVEGVSDPVAKEILREAAFRAVMMDTPWSAAFISYVVKEAGVNADAFKFSNAHRFYIYAAFATSIADVKSVTDGPLYRACPVYSTRPRVGDVLCHQRERTLVEATDLVVRDRIVSEIEAAGDVQSVRTTHCDVVAHIDAAANKIYLIGGNVQNSVTVKKLNLLRRSLKLSKNQKGRCGAGRWTLPAASPSAARELATAGNCSLTDKKWFVLLQVR
jgi:hypothetical protein